ncbi:MAG: hypothetical protein V5A64_03615 [Candidatus Thermoplasmatota archaeon]
MANYQTKHGFNDDEVVSALQKDIRRGLEKNALYWAFEICDGGEHKSGFSRLRNRLIIITYEDIGMGEPGTVLEVSNAVEDMENLWKAKNSGWKIVLAYIILKLCRAKKSRIADHFQNVIFDSWKNENAKEEGFEIPDYAIDMHTSKGNLRGRSKGSLKGVKHFIEEGEKLDEENQDVEDIYRKKAHEILKRNKR